ncbi:phage protein GemA/Gp16 family protein [Treponema pectinovorum]|uniref:phage protein GemA/Gp16 family protein n=1 Tax=Treponema pectinovorum TaxID=164 RepID=UPI0011C9BAE3|nr:phage protein GemA/Gp16 family protein [Treponema pectinovorum]
MPGKSNRNRLISLIHAQKKAAHLNDENYRTIVYGATGKQSCSECDMTELKTIFNDLNSILETQKQKPFRFFPARQTTQKEAVVARAKRILGDGWESRVTQFIQTKVKKHSLSFCTQNELRQVMGFISTIERTENKKNDGKTKSLDK